MKVLMNERLKTYFKYLGGTVLTLLIIYLVCFAVFLAATHPTRAQEKTSKDIALSKTPIVNVQRQYHLSRDVVSDSLEGTDKKGKKYYFVYLPKNKKAYLYQASKGLSRSQAIARFNNLHLGHDNLKVEFGWYKDKPVWEISYKKDNGNYGYAIISFKTGRELFYVDNI